MAERMTAPSLSDLSREAARQTIEDATNKLKGDLSDSERLFYTKVIGNATGSVVRKEDVPADDTEHDDVPVWRTNESAADNQDHA